MSNRKQYFKEYHQNNHEERKAKMRENYRKNKEQYKARKKKYRNESKICYFCDSEAEVGHHFDYSKPDEVIRLCWSCHGKVHYIISITSDIIN